VRARHRLVVDLLIAVGVPRPCAELDAEGIEHHVSDDALAAFARFLAETGTGRGGRQVDKESDGKPDKKRAAKSDSDPDVD
jgi:Mn-dependent DtxR family transcriptional regulator